MSDIIHLLPDTVANQIAAGEVIQRPASVIKELVENAIDAGASDIQIIIKEAGRTLIQVIDNGKGMSETDARLCFERHATSKIQSADDLFSLRTMGFRGEALASIGAIAQVELKTKRAEDEIGTLIEMAGGKIENQESILCPNGTNFSIKNIFYNVPARRRFLKSNTTEFTHIEKEFFRIVLVNPEVSFELIHNNEVCYKLKACNLKERIVNLFGKGINTQLLSINADSSIVQIYGYVGRPETAKKQNNKQYFFVNGRYMRHPYFHKAVMQAFDRMVQPNTTPDYFIYFNIDPGSIDVNIHPTKTEIKFENEQAIWPIIMACIKEALGKFNITQAIDFDAPESINFPYTSSSNETFEAPTIKTDPNYNPFAGEQKSYKRNDSRGNWEQLYSGFEKQSGSSPFENSESFFSATTGNRDFDFPEDTEQLLEQNDEVQLELNMEVEESKAIYFQYKFKYIFTTSKSGLTCIDQHRAHERILYDQYIQSICNQNGVSQKLLFPEILELLESETLILNDLLEELSYLGFEIEPFGKNTFSINGIPSDLKSSSIKDYLLGIIGDAKIESKDLKLEFKKKMALSLAKTTAITAGKKLDQNEMMDLVCKLFSSSNPAFTEENKKIISIFENDEIEKRFK